MDRFVVVGLEADADHREDIQGRIFFGHVDVAVAEGGLAADVDDRVVIQADTEYERTVDKKPHRGPGAVRQAAVAGAVQAGDDLARAVIGVLDHAGHLFRRGAEAGHPVKVPVERLFFAERIVDGQGAVDVVRRGIAAERDGLEVALEFVKGFGIHAAGPHIGFLEGGQFVTSFQVGMVHRDHGEFGDDAEFIPVPVVRSPSHRLDNETDDQDRVEGIGVEQFLDVLGLEGVGEDTEIGQGRENDRGLRVFLVRCDGVGVNERGSVLQRLRIVRVDLRQDRKSGQYLLGDTCVVSPAERGDEILRREFRFDQNADAFRNLGESLAFVLGCGNTAQGEHKHKTQCDCLKDASSFSHKCLRKFISL